MVLLVYKMNNFTCGDCDHKGWKTMKGLNNHKCKKIKRETLEEHCERSKRQYLEYLKSKQNLI